MSIAGGKEFACHETTVIEEDAETGEETLEVGAESQVCGGSLILMEKAGEPNQMARIAMRLRLYDPAKLDLDAPVHASFDAFIKHHGDDYPGDPDSEFDAEQTCEVCDPACLAPAGYMVGGSAIEAEPADPGVLAYCEGGCGAVVCEACSNDDGLCPSCEEAA